MNKTWNQDRVKVHSRDYESLVSNDEINYWLQGHKASCSESLTVAVSGQSLCLPLRNLTSSDRLPKPLQTLEALTQIDFD